MSVGATAVLLPDRPTPEAVLDVMRDAAADHLRWRADAVRGDAGASGAAAGAGSERLRLCISAGEALPRAYRRALGGAVGATILDGIGSTEMLHIFLSNRPDALRYGTSGMPVPGYDAADRRRAGERGAATGEIGELLVRGPSAAEGYWNQREKVAPHLPGRVDPHRRQIHARGGRLLPLPGPQPTTCSRSSGNWVSPFEVEAALMAHPAVLEAAVVGRQDADGLIKPMAFLVLKPGEVADPALLEELQGQVKARAGAWKYPRWLVVVDELPKTATGKIQRFKLREGLER